MAASDNVRVLYKDGLILGADELSDDQSYFRAALERRSLSSDLYGIAYGLELQQQGELIRVTPGVARDANGKTIVVRQPEDISGRLNGQPAGSYAVFLSFVENGNANQSRFTFCGAAMDPRVEESFRIDVIRPPPEALREGEHGGSRRPAQSPLPAPNDVESGRILLGVVRVELPTDAPQRFILETAASRVPGREPAEPAPAERAEYAGTVTAALIHPRHWTASGQAESRVLPALELDADVGIHLHQPSLHHAGMFITGTPTSFELATDGERLALQAYGESGVAVPVLTADAGATAVLGKLRVDGEVTLQSAATVKGLLDAAGGLSAKGTTHFEKVETDGDVAVGGVLAVRSGAAISGNINHQGSATLASGNDGLGQPNELTVEGTAHFKKDVTFDGAILNVSFTTLSCTNLAVTSSASVNGTLTCGNDVTLNGAGRLQVNAAGGLDVSGAAGVQVSGAQGLVVSGAGGVQVSGASGLEVSGVAGATISGAGGLTVSSGAGLEVAGPATITGPTTLAGVNASGPIIAQRGVALEVNAPAGAQNGLAVVPAGTITAGRLDVHLAPASVPAGGVLGILSNVNGTSALVIVSGYAEAITPPGTVAGDWLVTGGTNAGELTKVAVPPSVGVGVAKALVNRGTAALIPVLVCLG